MNVLFPRTLKELVDLRAAHPTGNVLAGGTDLLVRLRKQAKQPPVLLCISDVKEIAEIQVLPSEIRLGAAVTLQELLENQSVKEILPALHQAIAVMASPPVRHAATLGGNIVTASPAGDTLPPLYVFDATLELSGQDGLRRLPIGDFIAGPGKTALQPTEVLTAVSIPRPRRPVQSYYHKVGRRRAMAIAVASLAANLEVAPDGAIAQIRLAWGSVGPTVITLPEVESFLRGRNLSVDTLREAGNMASAAVRPIGDVRAGADYRRRLAGNLLFRLTAPA